MTDYHITCPACGLVFERIPECNASGCPLQTDADIRKEAEAYLQRHSKRRLSKVISRGIRKAGRTAR
jgi:hypothetical protein